MQDSGSCCGNKNLSLTVSDYLHYGKTLSDALLVERLAFETEQMVVADPYVALLVHHSPDMLSMKINVMSYGLRMVRIVYGDKMYLRIGHNT